MGEANEVMDETHFPDEIIFDFNPSLRVSFTGGEITSDAGTLLLRQVDSAFDLVGSLAKRLRDARDPALVKHPLAELIRERVYMIALGYEDTNDARTMRDDPALKLAVRGRGAEAFREPLASQPTVSRLEHEILLPRTEGGDLTADALHNLTVLEDAALEWTERVMARHEKRREITIDVDSTEDRVHGRQEGSAYNGYFGSTAFHPLFAHLGDGLGEILKAQLRPGNVYTSGGVVEFLAPMTRRLVALTTATLWLRGDSGFAIPALFELLEALDREILAQEGKRAHYAIKLKHNAVLERLVEPHCKRPVGRPPSHVVENYVELEYAAESWCKKRRVVAAITFEPGTLFPTTQFIVTNATPQEMGSEELFRFYRRRGDDSENRIKEAKNDIKIDRTSCNAFASNRVRLALATLAYQLAHWTRALGRPRGPNDTPPPAAPSLKTLRLLVLKIGARLALHARQAKLMLSTSAPAQRLFHQIAARIAVVARATAGSLRRAPLSEVLTT